MGTQIWLSVTKESISAIALMWNAHCSCWYSMWIRVANALCRECMEFPCLAFQLYDSDIVKKFSGTTLVYWLCWRSSLAEPWHTKLLVLWSNKDTNLISMWQKWVRHCHMIRYFPQAFAYVTLNCLQTPSSHIKTHLKNL